MLQFNLEGQAELSASLAALPDDLRAALAEKIDALAQNLLAQIVGVNLSGGVLNARSGRLRDSIQLRGDGQDETQSVEIYADGSAPYAAIQEFGGKTAAHDIIPDKSKVLAFMLNGKQMFARRVHHPGSEIPERSYMRSALAEQSQDIAEALRETLAAAVQRVKDSE
jgi:phage gpG-like protein